MKTCKRCEQEKPYDDFYRHGDTADGYQAWCKQCFKDYHRERYRAIMADPELRSVYKERYTQWNRAAYARKVARLKREKVTQATEEDDA